MPYFMDGNQAIATAAIDARCNFFAGYPITPATEILLHLSTALPKVGGIVLQGEDEIASLGFCIGAAMSGYRVMTATSGPGLSLYSENIGLAVMGEVPLVIVNVQRMGPATGAATTGAQGDIQFMRWGTSGGYPLIVLSPANLQDCYHLTLKAFDLAERFRVPVILATDKDTAQTRTTVELKRKPTPPVQEWKSLPPDKSINPLEIESPADIPPLSHFGGSQLIRFTASSHNQTGYLTKDPAELDHLNRHLSTKILHHQDEISFVHKDLQSGADTLVLSYGISAQSARAAVLMARDNGKKVSLLIIQSIWPVPEDAITQALQHIKTILIPELNLGQYAREIERLTKDHQEIIRINRVDGTLISPEQILQAGGLL